MATKPYFDNVHRNKLKHKFLMFHDCYRVLTDGEVRFCALHETCYSTLFTLVVYDDDLKYICETSCTYDEYKHLLETIPTLYHYKEFLPF